jgi:hypothetical protein
MDIKLLIALLPFVFMLHDFEEIIMFKPWLEKNRSEVVSRFPRIDSILKKNHDHLSTSGFSVAVLHEFLLISIITFLSLIFGVYQWWFGAFAAFSIHLLFHIGQGVVYGKYVPCIITSILALPYSIYTFLAFLKVTDMTVVQLSLWAVLGMIIAIASFVPAFYLASRFEDWKDRRYLQP